MMFTQTIVKLRTPSRLQWWEWGDILGGIGIFILTLLLALDRVLHPTLVAVLFHIAADFTCQSSETAMRKGERGRHLLLHALAAGGLPLAVAGLVTGNLVLVIIWGAIGAGSHYLVDWTHKFGLRSVALGASLDQASHLMVILMLTFFLL